MASATPAFPSNSETANYSRLCRLLVDVGSQVLRDTFDRIHPPANLSKVLSNPVVHSSLQALRRKTVLNAAQWDKLYPVSKASVSSKDFDITLLMVLFRNICGLSAPVTGWNSFPAATDLTPEADLVRVKFYRNTVCGHAIQASVDDATFNGWWNDIRETLIRLGGASYGTSIDALKGDCMDPDMEDHYRELLKQCSRDESSIKDRLDEVVEKLDELREGNPRLIPAKLETQLLKTEECRNQLSMHYNTCMRQVRITPWDRDETVDIDEIYTNLSLVTDAKAPSGTTKRDLDDYTQMFKGQGRTVNPKRIIIYGKPGIGKSTFSQKVAVDWANKKEETLQHFDLLLLIKLRDVCGKETVRGIFEASELLATDGPISCDSLYDYVRENQERVLLVLDGYDEYQPRTETRSVVHEIWEGKQLRNCHVVITTRPMEGEELVKFSHLKCEIRGFLSDKQVNDFAMRFLESRKEIEEFNSYLSKEKLWDLAEIPLLLLMLCLIWKDRYRKELPTTKLALHERFVVTLLCHMSLKDPDDVPLHSTDILNDYRNEINAIGKFAFEALLKGSVYVKIKDDIHSQNGSVIDKMFRSGLCHFTKLSSVNPGKTLLFLHKSIQEFLAAWYLIHEDHIVAVLRENIDSIGKALKMKEVLKFMCEGSVEGAKAVFGILELSGEKECLTNFNFNKTPSLDKLSSYQVMFCDVNLECLISCSTSFRQEVYPLFLAAVGGVVTISNNSMKKVAAENLLRSAFLPDLVFFEHSNFADFVTIIDNLRALIITCSGLRIRASVFLRMYDVPELKPEHFFVRRTGDQVYLHFGRVCRTFACRYFKLLRDLASPLSEASQMKHAVQELPNGQNTAIASTQNRDNCFSLVSEVAVFATWASEQLTFTRNLLTAVCFPRDVVMEHVQTDDNVVSYINFTENLSSLFLFNLQMSAQDPAFAVASSLGEAPNLHSLKITGSLLHTESVRSLGASFCHVPRLSYLTLSEVGMDDQGCASLATSLKHVPRLKALNLSKNHLGKGIIELARQLKNVPSLLHLDLERTDIVEEGAKALAQGIGSHVTSLRTLQVGYNPLGRGVREIVQKVCALSDLKQLDLEGVTMTRSEIDAVTDAQLIDAIVITSYHDYKGNPKPESQWPTLRKCRA